MPSMIQPVPRCVLYCPYAFDIILCSAWDTVVLSWSAQHCCFYSMQGKAPICVDANGRPSPSSDLNANVQRRVTFARRIQQRKEYRIKIPAAAIITTKAAPEHLITAPAAAFDVDVLVVLAFAMHYEGGDGLEDVMPMVDVSLDVDMAPLKQYLREMQDGNDLGGCSTPPPRDAADAAAEPAAARATREAINAWQNKYIRHLLDILDCMNQNSHLLKNL